MRKLDLVLERYRDFVQRGEVCALEAELLVVLVTVLQRQRFQLSGGQVRSGRKVQLQNFVARRDALFTQVLLEGRHVIGTHTKNVQCFQLVQMRALGSLRWRCPLEGKRLALQPNATPKKLNDLRAFALAHVQQAHGGNAPAAPTFGELARTDQHLNLAAFLVQRAKQRATEIVRFAVKRGGGIGQLEERGIVANVDQAKRIGITHTQRQLTLAVLDVDQLQTLAGWGVEYPLQDVVIQRTHIVREAHQRRETALENVVALGIQQLRPVGDQIGQPRLDLSVLVQEVGKEAHHFQDVRVFARHRVAHEHPQRLLDIEVGQLVAVRVP